ncbi:hypothetical protein WJX84_007272 [Apatococcus fuscideae]|uniref:Uncharacterized protein n=1 Tax=Apatococcus fuscideae TaxID=2026836 RepID=A0AAW1SVY2_9CHLO
MANWGQGRGQSFPARPRPPAGLPERMQRPPSRTGTPPLPSMVPSESLIIDFDDDDEEHPLPNHPGTAVTTQRTSSIPSHSASFPAGPFHPPAAPAAPAGPSSAAQSASPAGGGDMQPEGTAGTADAAAAGRHKRRELPAEQRERLARARLLQEEHRRRQEAAQAAKEREAEIQRHLQRLSEEPPGLASTPSAAMMLQPEPLPMELDPAPLTERDAMDAIQLHDPEAEKQLQQLLMGSSGAGDFPAVDMDSGSESEAAERSLTSPAGSRAMLKSRLWEQQAKKRQERWKDKMRSRQQVPAENISPSLPTEAPIATPAQPKADTGPEPAPLEPGDEQEPGQMQSGEVLPESMPQQEHLSTSGDDDNDDDMAIESVEDSEAERARLADRFLAVQAQKAAIKAQRKAMDEMFQAMKRTYSDLSSEQAELESALGSITARSLRSQLPPPAAVLSHLRSLPMANLLAGGSGMEVGGEDRQAELDARASARPQQLLQQLHALQDPTDPPAPALLPFAPEASGVQLGKRKRQDQEPNASSSSRGPPAIATPMEPAAVVLPAVPTTHPAAAVGPLAGVAVGGVAGKNAPLAFGDWQQPTKPATGHAPAPDSRSQPPAHDLPLYLAPDQSSCLIPQHCPFATLPAGPARSLCGNQNPQRLLLRCHQGTLYRRSTSSNVSSQPDQSPPPRGRSTPVNSGSLRRSSPEAGNSRGRASGSQRTVRSRAGASNHRRRSRTPSKPQHSRSRQQSPSTSAESRRRRPRSPAGPYQSSRGLHARSQSRERATRVSPRQRGAGAASKSRAGDRARPSVSPTISRRLRSRERGRDIDSRPRSRAQSPRREVGRRGHSRSHSPARFRRRVYPDPPRKPVSMSPPSRKQSRPPSPTRKRAAKTSPQRSSRSPRSRPAHSPAANRSGAFRGHPRKSGLGSERDKTGDRGAPGEDGRKLNGGRGKEDTKGSVPSHDRPASSAASDQQQDRIKGTSTMPRDDMTKQDGRSGASALELHPGLSPRPSSHQPPDSIVGGMGTGTGEKAANVPQIAAPAAAAVAAALPPEPAGTDEISTRTRSDGLQRAQDQQLQEREPTAAQQAVGSHRGDQEQPGPPPPAMLSANNKIVEDPADVATLGGAPTGAKDPPATGGAGDSSRPLSATAAEYIPVGRIPQQSPMESGQLQPDSQDATPAPTPKLEPNNGQGSILEATSESTRASSKSPGPRDLQSDTAKNDPSSRNTRSQGNAQQHKAQSSRWEPRGVVTNSSVPAEAGPASPAAVTSPGLVETIAARANKKTRLASRGQGLPGRMQIVISSNPQQEAGTDVALFPPPCLAGLGPHLGRMGPEAVHAMGRAWPVSHARSPTLAVATPAGIYISPLSRFRSYRLCETYHDATKAAFLSASYGNTIDPQWPLCPYEARGSCRNAKCPYQMAADYTLEAVQIVRDIFITAQRAGSKAAVPSKADAQKAGSPENLAAQLIQQAPRRVSLGPAAQRATKGPAKPRQIPAETKKSLCTEGQTPKYTVHPGTPLQPLRCFSSQLLHPVVVHPNLPWGLMPGWSAYGPLPDAPGAANASQLAMGVARTDEPTPRLVQSALENRYFSEEAVVEAPRRRDAAAQTDGGSAEDPARAERMASLEAAQKLCSNDPEPWLLHALEHIDFNSEQLTNDESSSRILKVLARGLEKNQASTPLWLFYLHCYSKRQGASAKIGDAPA